MFAGRGPRRPNRIGVTSCAIASVHGRELTVVGLDAVSGTPVIDLKPMSAEFVPARVEQPDWVTRMMSAYFPSAGQRQTGDGSDVRDSGLDVGRLARSVGSERRRS